MPEADVDGAYELLLVIVGIVWGIMSSYPYLFWADTPETTASMTAVRSVVLPLITSTLLWVIGKLLMDVNRKLVVKLAAWMYSIGIAISILHNYLIGVEFLSPIQGEQMQWLLSMSILFIVSPAFVYGIVYPRYREIYPDATFFKNKLWIVLTLVIHILLIAGVIFLSINV